MLFSSIPSIEFKIVDALFSPFYRYCLSGHFRFRSATKWYHDHLSQFPPLSEDCYLEQLIFHLTQETVHGAASCHVAGFVSRFTRLPVALPFRTMGIFLLELRMVMSIALCYHHDLHSPVIKLMCYRLLLSKMCHPLTSTLYFGLVAHKKTAFLIDMLRQFSVDNAKTYRLSHQAQQDFSLLNPSFNTKVKK